jgi:hypothetical protein
LKAVKKSKQKGVLTITSVPQKNVVLSG